MRKKPKICFISSAGGHLEQLRQLDKIRERYDYYWVLPRNKSTKKIVGKKYLINDFPRNMGKIVFFSGLFWTAIQQLIVFVIQRPDFVITTGAGVAYPTCMFAHICGKKLIYIESFARMKSLNVTGQKLYPYADLFVVQWKELLKLVPKAVYRGWIY